MAASNTRFTLMAIPQKIDREGNLSLNIIFIPRNINPLTAINTIYGPGNKALAFADVKPEFTVKVVNNSDEFPGKFPATELDFDAVLNYSSDIRKIYETLKDAKNTDGTPKYFDIDNNRSTDSPTVREEDIAQKPEEKNTILKKYLPVSYRERFNFTSPKIKNAVTDDSYHCAVRDQEPDLNLGKDDKVSWGKVYAHLLRQPLMAEKAGLLYKTTLKINPNDFKNGGWLYVSVKNGTTYQPEQNNSIAAGEVFIKQYAARILPLKKDDQNNFIEKALFAAVLFPVVKPGEDPDGIFDELFIESAAYQDGLAKILHTNQPASANLLQEKQDGFHPQKEMGIRLGWDDEQILIWYLRQMAKDESTSGGNRLDAPLGVMGYHIDVKEASVANGWESLTHVTSNGEMMLEEINLGSYRGELPFQVYPVRLYNANITDINYWLPMYFANWNDYSMVIPDKTAAQMYLNSQASQLNKDNSLTPRQVTISDTYSPFSNNVKLRYGNKYSFRVRLADISGGGPEFTANDIPADPFSITEQHFKRFLAPASLRISGNEEIKHSTDDLNFNGDVLTFKRPLLGYPAVVFTDKYTDAISLLQAEIDAKLLAFEQTGIQQNFNIGIADPDVVKVQITVEVETLQMDNLLSADGKEHFITLYETYRDFNAIDFNADLPINLTYRDEPVLNLNDPQNPFSNPADNATIAATSGEIILPTARNIRLTLKAVAGADEQYWGNVNDDENLDARYGKPTVLKLRRDANNEQNLYFDTDNPLLLQGLYLQPDIYPYNSRVSVRKLSPTDEGLPNIMQRLAKQINVGNNGLTLVAENGERIMFWCSNFIRHSMSPDNSSITFSGKNELVNQWLVVTSLYLNRDWTWDGFKPSAIHIHRKKKFTNDAGDFNTMPYQFIDDFEVKKTASFQAIQAGDDGKIHREYSRIILIDVIDALPAGDNLPDSLMVAYQLKPQFNYQVEPVNDGDFETGMLDLPATVNPPQTPKVIGAGIALSPYTKNDKYSSTEARKRFLWLEFDKQPENPADDLFARVLAYSPDQLLSNNHPDQFKIAEESPLPIDPEYIRVITRDSPHDHSGLKAMQKMEKSLDENRHFYLLPLPQGLHPESAELFGFFTYEFRFGHSDRLFSTAQGRFGRPFRLTGLQHPAPNLLLTVDRDEQLVKVSAPFAQAVYKGKNVTANPIRTSMWCLLYAQVRQADGQTNRNILLETIRMQEQENKLKIEKQINKINKDKSITEEVRKYSIKQVFNLYQTLDLQAVKYANLNISNKDIEEKLAMYGLPPDAGLSVLCVEVFGTITNLKQHISGLERQAEPLKNSFEQEFGRLFGDVVEANTRHALKNSDQQNREEQPLTSELGNHRILRTSPLTEVPFICCTVCD